MIAEPTTVGPSEHTASLMKLLVDGGQFAQLVDVYRFLISYAVAKDGEPSETTRHTTAFNIGTLDPNKEIYYITMLSSTYVRGTSVYKHAERLAEWASHNLAPLIQESVVDLEALFKELGYSGE